MNHPMSVTSAYSNSPPPIPRDRVPSVFVRSLPESTDALRTKQKRASVSDSSNPQCLKPLRRDTEEALPSNIIDLEYFRSIFLFPLDYLRGTLIAAYKWAQELLSPEQATAQKIDFYA